MMQPRLNAMMELNTWQGYNTLASTAECTIQIYMPDVCIPTIQGSICTQTAGKHNPLLVGVVLLLTAMLLPQEWLHQMWTNTAASACMHPWLLSSVSVPAARREP